MWKPRRPTTLWASTACYRDSFTFLCVHLEYNEHFTLIIQKSPISATADIEHRKVCDIPSRNPETISFRKGRKVCDIPSRNPETISFRKGRKVCDIPSRNPETISFRKGRK
jgi:hypothetical protein